MNGLIIFACTAGAIAAIVVARRYMRPELDLALYQRLDPRISEILDRAPIPLAPDAAGAIASTPCPGCTP